MHLSVFDEFLYYIQKNNLFNRENRLLLAVSGGIDSMVMAHLFLKLGTNTGIAHCNFCLRDIESDKDEELVRKFADENRIPFFSIRFNTKEYAASKRISIQMAARELRYEWFEKLRVENNFDFIAVAHNLNDNIETLLINLTRGTGLTGLTGMRPVSRKIIRPLLFASRRKIEEYCSYHQLAFREDKTNAETMYTRNKIRHMVIPVLKEINPSVEETLNETAERLAGIDEFVSGHIDQIRTQTSVADDNTIVFDLDRLLNLQIPETLVFELFAPYGITGATSRDLIRLLTARTGKQVFTQTHRIVRNRNELIVTPLETGRREYHEINIIEDLLRVQGIVSAEVIDVSTGFEIPDDQKIACLDLEKIRFPFLIRHWKKGDYFFPLGMKHKKKLSDFFVDRQYSLVKKDQTLVLESEGKIAWIIGERIDERFKVTESTSKILLLRLFPGRS
jgi:tRNA(Ile)-lysidine synthase